MGNEAAKHEKQATSLSASGHVSDAAALLDTQTGLATQVELSIRCTNLADLDTFSKSDPMVVVYQLRDNSWQEIGRSEVVGNNTSPRFVKLFKLTYRFEEIQKLKFVVYDVDSARQPIDLANQDLIGFVECTLANIMGGRNNSKTLPLRNLQHASRARGTMTITGEELAHQTGMVTLQLGATKLDNLDTFSKSDPFLVISRLREDGSTIPVYKSEVVMNNLSPVWRAVNIPLQKLCNGDMHRPLVMEVEDWDSDGSHDFIGRATLSLQDLLDKAAAGKRATPTPLVNPAKKARKRKYKDSGTLRVLRCSVKEMPSFLNYVSGGCELNFMVAIDFTGSNGHPLDSISLHYSDPSGRPNQYEVAIRSIGQVIECYDTDRLFPAYGFGARLGSGPVQHCFPLNNNAANPFVAGVEGILQAYKAAIQNVTLSGPTIFSQILDAATQVAQSYNVSQQNQRYLVLLILTDGVVNDMDRTIAAIISASALPLSVLIVGVGDADFADMERLDGDEQRLSLNGRVAQRDIVQFVSLKEHVDMRRITATSAAAAISPSLSAALLAEIPDQLTSFMKLKGITPNPAQPQQQVQQQQQPPPQAFQEAKFQAPPCDPQPVMMQQQPQQVMYATPPQPPPVQQPQPQQQMYTTPQPPQQQQQMYASAPPQPPPAQQYYGNPAAPAPTAALPPPAAPAVAAAPAYPTPATAYPTPATAYPTPATAYPTPAYPTPAPAAAAALPPSSMAYAAAPPPAAGDTQVATGGRRLFRAAIVAASVKPGMMPRTGGTTI